MIHWLLHRVCCFVYFIKCHISLHVRRLLGPRGKVLQDADVPGCTESNHAIAAGVPQCSPNKAAPHILLECCQRIYRQMLSIQGTEVGGRQKVDPDNRKVVAVAVVVMKMMVLVVMMMVDERRPRSPFPVTSPPTLRGWPPAMV